MANQVKKKRKINKVNLWATLVSIIAMIGLVGLVAGIAVIATLLKNKPTLNVSDFDQAESSIVYDSEGLEIANLGTVIRQNIEYDNKIAIIKERLADYAREIAPKSKEPINNE